MERYNRITNKNQREIVLLQGRPCAWGKCRFCDYIDDNSRDREAMLALNRRVLSRVTGEFGVLEVINSGSCFELPRETLEEIRRILRDKNIRHLYFEAHWMYRKHLQEMRDFMGVPITFKIGVETFDNDFRERVLNKHADFQTPEEVARYFDSPCLMVGIQGQKLPPQEIAKVLAQRAEKGVVPRPPRKGLYKRYTSHALSAMEGAGYDD